MSDAARPTHPATSPEDFRDLLERLNRDWRIEGYPPTDGSLPRTVLYKVRTLLARLLGTQETFNSEMVRLLNSLGPALGQAERYHEAIAARERRMEAGLERIRAEHDELRTTIAVLRQGHHDLMRELARRDAGAGAGGAAIAAGAGAPAASAASGASAGTGRTSSEALSHKYVGFEDQFRGSAEVIRERLTGYVELFAGASDVLDIGCGRGEFLALLKARGITGRGIDVNESMIEVCRQKGLDASGADALEYLRAQPANSLGGLLAAQVVEHLEPGYLTALLDAAFGALRPGAPIVLETINPACWFAFFESYVRDITHVRPLHPETLKFLLLASGFSSVEIQYKAPYPEHDKLQRIPPVAGLTDAVEVLNSNVNKINGLLFTYLDYAAVARRA